MNTFEFDGEKYQKASKHQQEWGNSLISELSLNGNEAILDLGCGDGRTTAQLAKLVPNGKVVGIDASIGMIETAMQRAGDNLTFIQLDINNLDYHNTFDIIFSNAALHWIKDHKTLLANSYSALRDNGILLWDFAENGNCSEKYKQYFYNFEWPWYMPDKDDYIKLISDSGFNRYTVTEVNRDRYFKNTDEMIKWIDQPSIVPFISILPEDIKKEFRRDVIHSMIKKTLQPDGTCFETFRRIHVLAYKVPR